MAQSTPELEPERQRQPRRQRNLLPSWIGAGLLAAGLTIGAMALTPAVDPALNAAQQQSRMAAFTAHGPLRLPVIAAAERASALAGMQLPPDQRTTLEQDLARGRLDLVWLTLWDDQAEDGDIVQVESHAFVQKVTLRQAPVQVAIPRAPGEMVLLRGIYDGGGGITVAALSRSQALPLPVMAPGQIIGLRVGP